MFTFSSDTLFNVLHCKILFIKRQSKKNDHVHLFGPLLFIYFLKVSTLCTYQGLCVYLITRVCRTFSQPEHWCHKTTLESDIRLDGSYHKINI